MLETRNQGSMREVRQIKWTSKTWLEPLALLETKQEGLAGDLIDKAAD